MVAGSWYNNDGLNLQYGTQKAVPEIGGDYLVYGETREIETYIPLVPTSWGLGNPPVAAPPTSLTFSGTGTAAQAGIQSLTTMFPMQITAPQTAASSALSLTNPQLFIERIELVTLQTIAPTTNTMTVGLVSTNPGNPSTFAQVTPNAGFQLIGTSAATGLTLNAAIATVGSYTLFAEAGVAGGIYGPGTWTATTGNGGAWLGNVPLVTNTFTTQQGGQTLPESAWISVLTNGAFTAGLIKMRIRYNVYGNINY